MQSDSRWYDTQSPPPQRLRLDTFQRRNYDCQQGDGEIMFWLGIINNEMVGPFRVKDGVKITAKK